MLNKGSFIFLFEHRAKIKNIEQTEEAKLKLMKERMTKRKDDTTFVPTNMAVNFVQHNRCKSLYILSFILFPSVNYSPV